MIKEFIKPTWMRMTLFPILLLVLPATFKVCNGTCNYEMQWFAGTRLFMMREIGELTFSLMITWFIIAYFLACLITVNYEYFTEY